MTEDAGAIIVHYGPFSLLDRCIEHLKTQTRSIVVVNNDPHSVPASLRSRHCSVFWEEPGTNLGFGRGVNRGFACGKRSRYVLVMNPDVTAGRELVSELAAYLERHPEMAVAGPRLLHPDGSLQTSGYRLPSVVQLIGYLLAVNKRLPRSAKALLADTPLRHYFGQLDPHREEKTVEMVTGACMMIRRKAFIDAGPFDPGFFLYYEEKDLCKRLRNAGWQVGFTPEATAFHMIGGSGSPSSPDAIGHRALGALRYFRRHGSPAANMVVASLFAVHAIINLVPGHRRQLYRDILASSLSRAFPCDCCS